MEERKLIEIKYYDREAGQAGDFKKELGSSSSFDLFLLESYQFLKNFLQNGNENKNVLDYGCGTGVHLPWLSKSFKEVTGIDLSQNSLRIVEKRIESENLKNVKLVLGDCEKTEFQGEFFDTVFDGGTFSSLDLNNALKEIHRILKSGGMLIGIETLGHNPLANFKRKINKILGKRTAWAESHIFKLDDLDVVKRSFDIVELRFYHIISWPVFPFLNWSGGKILLKSLESLDHILLKTFPFLKKYSFKIVFILRKK